MKLQELSDIQDRYYTLEATIRERAKAKFKAKAQADFDAKVKDAQDPRYLMSYLRYQSFEIHDGIVEVNFEYGGSLCGSERVILQPEELEDL